jgi:hypothetical protein
MIYNRFCPFSFSNLKNRVNIIICKVVLEWINDKYIAFTKLQLTSTFQLMGLGLYGRNGMNATSRAGVGLPVVSGSVRKLRTEAQTVLGHHRSLKIAIHKNVQVS